MSKLLPEGICWGMYRRIRDSQSWPGETGTYFCERVAWHTGPCGPAKLDELAKEYATKSTCLVTRAA